MTQNDTTSSRTSESSGAVESAYRYIRGSIIRGELTSGEVLLESNLAERIGVSRTPVREALSRLASEGLVVLGRYRRAQVASFSMVDVAEVFRLRGKLEGHAARRACLRITTADIQRLEAIEDELEAAFAKLGWHQHLPRFDELNNEFHAIIARAADSQGWREYWPRPSSSQPRFLITTRNPWTSEPSVPIGNTVRSLPH